MIGRTSKTIDGVTYHVLPLPTGASIRVTARVLKMAAPAFGDVTALVSAARRVTSALDALASGLLADLDEDVLMFLCDQFARETNFEVSGKTLPLRAENADHFDEHFRGRFMPMLEWLAFAAGVTFPFVAAALGAAKAKQAEAVAAASAASAAAQASASPVEPPAAG